MTILQRTRCLGVALAFLIASPGAAQEMGPPAPPAAAPAPAPAAPVVPNGTAPATQVPASTPAAIALPEIAAHAENTERWLHAIEAAAAPDPVLAAIEQTLDERKKTLEERSTDLEDAVEHRAGLDGIVDMERKLAALSDEIKSWETATKLRAEKLETRVAELGVVKETWDLTLERAKAEAAPDSVLDRVKEIRKQIKATQTVVQEQRSSVLTLQGRVAELVTTVSLLTDSMNRARFEIRGRLLEADRKPLWKTVAKTRGIDSVVSRVGESLARDGATLRTFAVLEQVRIRYHALLFAGFLALAWVLRGWARRRRAAGKQIGPAPRVYERPFSVAALCTLVVTPWLYPHAPLAVGALIGLVLLVPTFGLVLEVLAPELRRLWLVIGGFYLVDRLRYVVQSVELLERSIFLLEMVAAVAVVVRLLRRGYDEKLSRLSGLSPRTVGRVLRIMAVAFGVAAVADVTGLYTLSKVIADGLLTSVYVGVVFYAALNVVRPMVPALLGSRPLRALNAVQRYYAPLERGIGRLLAWVAIVAWGRVVLERFTVGEPIWSAVSWLVRTPVSMGTISISLGNVLAFAAIVVFSIGASRAISILLEEDVLPRTRLGRGIPHAIARTASYGVFLIGMLLALGAVGIDLSRVTVLAGAFGVGIGFGLQNIVNNFLSGLILLYERPIQVGDTVEVGALTGEVRRIGIRSSTLRTFQGAEVIVPNSNLIQEQVVNWTLSDRQRRMELLVGVAYGTQPERVIDLLLEVARTVPEVNEEPAPLAIFKGFGDNALNFELRAWTRLENHLQVQSNLAIAINGALQKNGIAIPFPQRDVRLIVDDKRKSS